MKRVLILDNDPRVEELVDQLQRQYETDFRTQAPDWQEFEIQEFDLILYGSQMNLNWSSFLQNASKAKMIPILVGLSLGSQKVNPLQGVTSVAHYMVSRASDTELIVSQIEKLLATGNESQWFYDEKLNLNSGRKIRLKRKMREFVLYAIGVSSMILLLIFFEWYSHLDQGSEAAVNSNKKSRPGTSQPNPSSLSPELLKNLQRVNPGKP